MRGVGFAAVFVAILLLVPAVHAGSMASVTAPSKRTVTIANNDYEAFSINIGADWSLVLGITVQSTGNIDVYVTDQQGYNQYTSPTATSFRYLVSWTQENVRAYNKTVTESGVKIVILDNADVTTSGASPSGPATVELYLGRSQTSFLLGLVILILVVVAIVALAVFRRRRAKRAQPPPMMPPQMPPQAPPPTQP